MPAFDDSVTVADVLTSYNGPNYHGILHKASPEESPFKSLIIGAQGGLGAGAVLIGDMSGRHREFEWSFYSLRTPSATRQRVDGFKTLSAEARKREQVKNVLQTHTESYEVAFEKQSQIAQFDGINADQGPNPVTDELGWQGIQMMTQINLDQELSLLYATYNLPVDNTTAARTRGIDEAITSNRVSGREAAKDAVADATADDITVTAHGYTDGDQVFFTATTLPGGLAADTRYWVINATANDFQVAATEGGAAIDITSAGTAVQVARAGSLTWALAAKAGKEAVEVAGKAVGEGLVAMANTDQLLQISQEFKDLGLEPRDRTIYGVSVQTVVTPFGPLNLLYNRHVNQGQVIGLNPLHLRMWHRFVPPHDDVMGGITFTYRVARTGNTTERAIYSSVGLEYGLEKAHFSIDDLALEKS